MWRARKRQAAKGFTLLETMISLVVLGIGVLGLAAMLADSLAYMQGSEYDFVAQQKAEEAAEAIYTAKYTNNATFAQLSNNTAGNPAGLFLVGPQPLLVPGADGLVGSVADAGGNPAYIVIQGQTENSVRPMTSTNLWAPSRAPSLSVPWRATPTALIRW